MEWTGLFNLHFLFILYMMYTMPYITSYQSALGSHFCSDVEVFDSFYICSSTKTKLLKL